MARPAGVWLFAEMFFQGDSKEWSTEFWYQTTATVKPVGYNPNDTAVAVQAGFAAAFEAILSTQMSCVGTRVEVNFGAGTFGGETHLGFAGNNVAALVPEDVCAVVRKNTQTGGRSGSGRWRISGLCVDALHGSYLSTQGVTLMSDFETSALAQVTDGTINWTPSLYSPKLNTLTAITSVQTDAMLGTARKRRGRF